MFRSVWLSDRTGPLCAAQQGPPPWGAVRDVSANLSTVMSMSRLRLSGIRMDWSVNSGLSRVTVTAFRICQVRYQARGAARLALLPLDVAAWAWMALVTGTELPSSVIAGAGLRLPHAGRGVIVHPSCVVGTGVTLYHRVTLGIRNGNDTAPRLGNNVYVGCGTILLGSSRIGDDAQVGAGAVVVEDVPSQGRAIGPKAVIRNDSRS